MLGIDDPWIVAAYLLCVASAVLCVVWGIVGWNRGGDEVKPVDVAWAAEEIKAEEEIGK